MVWDLDREREEGRREIEWDRGFDSLRLVDQEKKNIYDEKALKMDGDTCLDGTLCVYSLVNLSIYPPKISIYQFT